MKALLNINDATITVLRKGNSDLMLRTITLSNNPSKTLEAFQSFSPEQQETIVTHQNLLLSPLDLFFDDGVDDMYDQYLARLGTLSVEQIKAFANTLRGGDQMSYAARLRALIRY